MSTLQGSAAEDKACKYLMEQGLTLRCRNYRTRRGELDIVMQDGSTIVCVEVKYRRRNQFGSALEFVTAKKLQRIQAAFDFYLLDNGLNPASTSLRIDVVAIDGSNLQWLRNRSNRGFLECQKKAESTLSCWNLGLPMFWILTFLWGPRNI